MTDHRDANIGAVGQDVAAVMRARRAARCPSPPHAGKRQPILHSSGPCYSSGGSALLSARIYSFN